MSVVNGYVDELDSFVDEVIEWRAEASSESSEVGADVVSVTAVNFLDYTLDVVEAAGKLLEADRDDKGLEVVEDVVQEYNEARFSQMTTWYEHRTAVQNVESNMKDSGDYHLFAEEIQENIWDAMDITWQVHEEVQGTGYADEVEQNYDQLLEENSDTLDFIESVEQAYEEDVSFHRGLELVKEGNPVRE